MVWNLHCSKSPTNKLGFFSFLGSDFEQRGWKTTYSINLNIQQVSQWKKVHSILFVDSNFYLTHWDCPSTLNKNAVHSMHQIAATFSLSMRIVLAKITGSNIQCCILSSRLHIEIFYLSKPQYFIKDKGGYGQHLENANYYMLHVDCTWLLLI